MHSSLKIVLSPAHARGLGQARSPLQNSSLSTHLLGEQAKFWLTVLAASFRMQATDAACSLKPRAIERRIDNMKG
jgi:hypothetical protein